MRKLLMAGALISAILLLAGCSTPDRATQARDLCIKSAEEQAGSSVTPKDVEAMNMGDALYDAEITDERDTDDADSTFAVTGEITWEKDGTQTRKSMLCTVIFNGGEAETPVEASLF